MIYPLNSHVKNAKTQATLARKDVTVIKRKIKKFKQKKATKRSLFYLLNN